MKALLNDLAILGVGSTKRASINTSNGTFHEDIDIVGIDLDKEDALIEEFNGTVKVNEYIGGVTYSFVKISKQKTKSIYIMSSSLEEIWEMFKADRTNQTIPERKCNFMKYMKNPI